MNRKEFIIHNLIAISNLVFREPDEDGGIEDSGEEKKLNYFLKNIESEFNKHRIVVKNNDLFVGFKEVNRSAQIKDFSKYFPFYKAGERKYRVPWLLLWVIHLHESGVSRHPNPESSGYLGAMQRNGYFYDDGYVGDSYRDWEFLNLLPQRYKKENGSKTSDFEEIMFAAKKIREDANAIMLVNPSLTDEEGLLLAQYRYCAYVFAEQRIRAFKKIKKIFNKREMANFE